MRHLKKHANQRNLIGFNLIFFLFDLFSFEIAFSIPIIRFVLPSMVEECVKRVMSNRTGGFSSAAPIERTRQSTRIDSQLAAFYYSASVLIWIFANPNLHPLLLFSVTTISCARWRPKFQFTNCKFHSNGRMHSIKGRFSVDEWAWVCIDAPSNLCESPELKVFALLFQPCPHWPMRKNAFSST